MNELSVPSRYIVMWTLHMSVESLRSALCAVPPKRWWKTTMMWRLSRVADYYQCEALRRRRRQRQRQRGKHGVGAAAEGHVPVYVGEEMERFEVPTRLLNRPAIVELLSQSAQEYGYQQRGVLRIPCSAPLFRRLLAAAAVEEAEEELLQSSFDERSLSSFDRC